MRLIIEARLADEGSDNGHDVEGVLAVIADLDPLQADQVDPLQSRAHQAEARRAESRENTGSSP
ncbi:hypothetical protein [Cupriavidus lacunae]|uniref:hypothetical protein n=1 Tax=Cupriavidus lacunae TaxID=2666307 RepID=UPI001058CC6A|nr:hypothetical protein [Cupriavidus lacunae]